jgi:hypothetical protein
VAYKLALEGDLNAIKFIFERIEGKPAEATPPPDDDAIEEAFRRLRQLLEGGETD